jgi:uncharacterized protein YjeT (DUF2065 family)
MIKYLLFGIGFFLLAEGLIYFFLANRLKDFYEILISFKNENIRFFSSILILLGLCLIYFTLKIYKL